MSQNAHSLEVNSKPLKGICILILGNSEIKNNLLSYYLQHNGGSHCLLKSMEKLDQILDQTDLEKCNMILMDVADLALANLKRKLIDVCLSNTLVALFDLDPKIQIEKYALTKGVKGFFYSSDPSNLLIKGITKIVDGELWIPRSIMERFIMEKSKAPVVKSTKLHISSAELYVLTKGVLPNKK